MANGCERVKPKEAIQWGYSARIANVRERRRTSFWRRGRDSNPRYGYPYAAFRVRCIQPLCHLSKPLHHRQFFDLRECGEPPMVTEMVTKPIYFARPVITSRNAASSFAAASLCIVSVTCE
jgi:hypothetical protein